MKKIFLIVSLIMFTTPLFAGSCQMLAKQIEDKIAEAQKLKDSGMEAHNACDHTKSEVLLKKALELFKD